MTVHERRRKRINLRAYKPRSLPPVHGTRAHYVHGKCRCDLCKTANRFYELARRAVRAQATFDLPAWALGAVTYSARLGANQ